MSKNYLYILAIIISFIFTGTGECLDKKADKYFFYENYFLNLDNFNKVKTIPAPFSQFRENDNYLFAYTKGFKRVAIFSMETLKKIGEFKIDSKWEPAISDIYIISKESSNLEIYDFSGKKVRSIKTIYPIKNSDTTNQFYSEAVIYKDKIFTTIPNNGLNIVDIKTGKTKLLQNNEENIEGDINGYDLLFTVDGGVVHVKDLDSQAGIIIYKYDENGALLFKSKIDHTDIETKDGMRMHHRYLNYLTHTEKKIIFTTNVFEKKYNKTKIVDLNTGAVNTANMITSGILIDKSGDLKGLLSVDEDRKLLTFYSPDGKRRKWAYAFPKNFEAYSAPAISSGNKLIVALYYPISTGSHLIAVDINNGSPLWNADVKQLNVEHSQYRNEVHLSRHKDKVVMVGLESYGSYLQIFDIESGKRLFTDQKM